MIITCQYCENRVIPKADGTCPACQKTARSIEPQLSQASQGDVSDSGHVAVESEPAPDDEAACLPRCDVASEAPMPAAKAAAPDIDPLQAALFDAAQDQDQRKIQRHRRASVAPGGFWGAAAWCLLIGMIQILVAIPVGVVLVAICGQRPAMAVRVIVTAQAAILIVFVLAMRQNTRAEIARVTGFRRPSKWHVKLVLVLIVPLHAAARGILGWTDRLMALIDKSTLSYVERSFVDLAHQPWPIMILVGCLLPAAAEELFFRGFLGRGLIANRGVFWGTVGTSFLFALVHVQQQQLLFAFVFGIVLHLVFLATQSILIPMLLHSLNNLLALVPLKLAVDGIWDTSGPDGVLPIPRSLLVPALAAVVATGWLLRGLRTTWLLPDSKPWHPGYPTTESPREEVGAVSVVGKPSIWTIAITGVLLLWFAGMAILAIPMWQAYAWANRAMPFLDADQYDEALVNCEKAIAFDPLIAFPYALRGDIRFAEGDYVHALTDYRMALQRDPSLANVHLALGDLYEKQDEHQQAVRACTRALKLDPELADAYSSRAISYNNLHEYDNAIDDCTAAIRLSPKVADAYRVRAYAHHAKGDFEEAIADCDRALRLDPTSADAYHERGKAHHGAGRNKLGLADVDKAIQIDSEMPWYYATRRDIHRDLGNAAQAVEDAKRFNELQ